MAILIHDEDAWVTETTSTVCAHHKAHPEDRTYAGCMCGGSIMQRLATPAERLERRRERLIRRKQEIEAELDTINRELS